MIANKTYHLLKLHILYEYEYNKISILDFRATLIFMNYPSFLSIIRMTRTVNKILNCRSCTVARTSKSYIFYRKLQYAFHDFYLSVKHTGYYIKAFVLSDRYVINLFAESSNKQYIFQDRYCISRYLVLNIACTTCLISCKHECASSHVIE